MTKEDIYRKKAKYLLGKVCKAKSLFAKHKPSIGYVGEQVLRQAIRKLIPNDFDVCQGFILNNSIANKDILSNQCDIIIFHKEKEAIAYSIGDLKVINSRSAVAVIEVKSSIRKESFYTTLKAFEKLNEIGVNNTFVFIFGSLSKQSLERWIFHYKLPENNNDEWIIMDADLYDWPDKEWLPNAILSLESCNFYKLDHLQDEENDWVGYASYIIKDRKNKEVSCLQEFFANIMTMLNGSLEIDINGYSIKDGFLLFRM